MTWTLFLHFKLTNYPEPFSYFFAFKTLRRVLFFSRVQNGNSACILSLGQVISFVRHCCFPEQLSVALSFFILLELFSPLSLSMAWSFCPCLLHRLRNTFSKLGMSNLCIRLAGLSSTSNLPDLIIPTVSAFLASSM